MISDLGYLRHLSLARPRLYLRKILWGNYLGWLIQALAGVRENRCHTRKERARQGPPPYTPSTTPHDQCYFSMSIFLVALNWPAAIL